MRKLAIIRDNQTTICPFGLPIAASCKIAGDSVDQMQVIDFDNVDRQVVGRNLEIMHSVSEPGRCKYAARLFKQHPYAVDCDWGDTAAGLSQSIPLMPSPYYTQIFEGLGMSGMYNYPTSYQSDVGMFRNPYYGFQQWAARAERRQIRRLKLARR